MALVIPQRFNIASHFIDRPATTHPDRVAILGEPATFHYRDLRAMVSRVAGALLGEGCKRNDRVLMVLPDSMEFIAAFFGTARIGAIAVPVNPFTRSSDYGYYLADCGAEIAIVHQDALGEVLAAGAAAHLKRMVVVGADGQGSDHRAVSWSAWVEGASPALDNADTAATDPAFFLYTSGSGGTPKGAVHQHKDMLVTFESFAHGVLGLRADDRTLSVSKLFFAYGLGNGMYFPFGVGAATILNPERPRPSHVLEMVARHRPTIFFSVPTFYAALLREAERGAPADFSSVRVAVSAGEALPAEVYQQCRKRFGIEVVDGIGSTEMLHMFISNRPGHSRPSSCGLEVPNYEAKILGSDGETVAGEEVGNLWVKGQSAFAEYWNKPELTAQTRQGEWVNTGDKFYRDSDGFYHYCGRADDMMKVSGMWVSPGEVENALLGHPAVAEAAVVAGLDAEGLTSAVAHVVLRAGFTTGSDLGAEILASVRGRLPGYKCPKEICFLAELPKTATGKIQRFRLREGRPA